MKSKKNTIQKMLDQKDRKIAKLQEIIKGLRKDVEELEEINDNSKCDYMSLRYDIVDMCECCCEKAEKQDAGVPIEEWFNDE
jgi:peptidoglycan hydrolase CwlO-like protein